MSTDMVKELEAQSVAPTLVTGDRDGPLAQLGPTRKNALLLIFSVAQFIDVCNVSGVTVAVAQISVDIALDSLTFAAFLLFAGRVSDLFPARIVFEGGFLLLGVFSLVTSFVTSSKYGFLILRGIGGVCGAMTIPSSYHLVVHMFPDPTEQQGKLQLMGLAGAVGNVLGLVLAGITMLANYRWFFRLLAIICISFSIVTFFLLPYNPSTTQDAAATDKSGAAPRWKRLDIVGVLLMAGTLICFILSLTQGPIDGWGSASFIAPFILSFLIGPAFFLWEWKIPSTAAVLPASVWKITNMVTSSLVILYVVAFWITSQIQFANHWQEVLGWKPIHVAAAMLPQGIIALILGGVVQAVPGLISRPRITVPVAAGMIMVAVVLQIYSNGGHGLDYWAYCFPAFLIGSSGALLSYFASAINLIQNCPPEMAGVAGAWVQVVAQVGGAVCLAVQAGLQGTNADRTNWKKSSGRGFWFYFAFVATLALQYVVFYKKPAPPQEEHELARRRMKEAGFAEP